jgi:hypothetical protein
MLRSWAYRTIPTGGTCPAFFSTFASAPAAPTTDSNGDPIGTVAWVLASGDGKLFKAGDHIFAWKVSNTTQKPDVITDVLSISTDTLTVRAYVNPASALAIADWIILSQDCTSVALESNPSNTHEVGVGTGPLLNLTTGYQLVTRALAAPVSGLAPTQVSISAIFGGNPTATSEYFLVGTSGEKFLPSYLYV